MNDSKINGNLVRDPYISQFTYTNKNDGTEVTCKRAVFTIANDIVKARKIEKANYIPVIAFGKLAEIVENNLKKGDSVLIEGFLISGQYEKDGSTVYTVTLKADNIEFIRLKSENTQNNKDVDEEKQSDDFETVDDTPFESFIDDLTAGLNMSL